MAIEGLADIIKNSMESARGNDNADDGLVADAGTPEGDNAAGDGTEFIPSDDPDPIEGEGDGDEPVEEPVVEGEPPVEKEVVKEPVDDGEDEFAKENGIKSKDKSGRENRIPYSAVKRINANAITKAQTKWAEAHGIEVQSRDARIGVYEDRLKTIGTTEAIMFSEPSQFLGMLLSIPGYKEILGDVQLDTNGHVTRVGGGGAIAAADAAADAADPEPQPDVNEGGQVGYTPAQHAKLRAWDRRQASRDAVKAARESVDKDYGGVRAAFTTHQGSVKQTQAMNAQIDTAFTWPGFKENNAAILKAMEDDYQAHGGVNGDHKYQFKTLKDAYDHTLYQIATRVGETAAQMETRIRKEVNAALARAPRSSSAGAGAAAVEDTRGNPPASDGSTASIIAASLRKR